MSNEHPEPQEPYVGPRPFEESDRKIFFGRQRETDELISFITAHQLVLVYAQSGVGKTSLLKASLIPALREEEKFDVLSPARVRSQDAGDAGSARAARSVYLYNALGYLSRGKLRPARRARLSLVEFLQRRKQVGGRLARLLGMGKKAPLLSVPGLCVIFFDQFEEIFTLHPEKFDDRQRFFENVRDALAADPLLRIVFVMREDYIAQLDPYAPLLPEKLRSRYRLEPLQKEAALAAIKDPLRLELKHFQVNGRQREFDAGVAERLRDSLLAIRVRTPGGEQEVEGKYVDTVQLQVVCQKLWRSLSPGDVTITEQHREKFANVTEALAGFYENCIREAVGKTGVSEAVLRGWFERTLITSAGTRGMVYRGRNEENAGGIPDEAVRELENQHILRVELRNEEPWYELSHDRFIQPIRESNRKWLLSQPLDEQKKQQFEDRAAEWMRLDREPRLLMDEVGLRDAENWINSPEAERLGYSATLLAYYKASQTYHEQRRARRMSWIAAGLAVGSLLMAGMTVFAFTQRSEALQAREEAIRERYATEKARAEAEDQRRRAEAAQKVAEERGAEAVFQREVADVAKVKAEKARKEAEAARAEALNSLEVTEQARKVAEAQTKLADEQRVKAERQKAIADAFLLKAQSRAYAANSIIEFPNNPELSALLASEAVKRDRNEESEEAFRTSLASLINVRSALRLPPLTGKIDQAVFTPDGQTVVTRTEATDTSVVRTWNAITGKRDEFVSNVIVEMMSDDGQIGVALSGGDVVVRNARTGDVIRKIKISPGPPYERAVLSSDGKLLAGMNTGDASRVRVWDTATGREVASLSAEPDYPFFGTGGMKFSPDNKLLAVVVYSNHYKIYAARVWDVAASREVRVVGNGDQPITALAFSPNGKYLVVGGEYGRSRFWDITRQGVYLDLDPTTRGGASITDIAFSPAGDRFVTTTADGKAYVWALEDMLSTIRAEEEKRIKLRPDARFQLAGHQNIIQQAAFSRDGQYVATASSDNTARIWEATTGREVDVLRGHSGPVTGVSFSPDGQMVLTSSEDGTARLWNTKAGPTLTVLRGHNDDVFDSTYSPDGKRIITASSDGTIRIWDVASGKILRTMYGYEGAVYRASFSPDGKFIVAAMRDGTARIFEAVSGLEILTYKGHETSVVEATFSPDGRQVATGSSEGEVHIWGVDTGQGFALPSKGSIRSLSFSPDAKHLLVVSSQGAVVWDLTTHKIIGNVPGAVVSSAAFSPKGQYIAVLDFLGKMSIYNAASYEFVKSINAHVGFGFSVAFSPDGKLVVTSGEDGVARVWAVGTWERAGTLRGHTGYVWSAKFSPGSDSIVTAGSDGTARIYPAESFAPITELQAVFPQRVTRELTAEEQQKYLVGSPIP